MAQIVKARKEKRLQKLGLTPPVAQTINQAGISQACHQWRREESQLMDNRAREAQIELAKALAAIGYACANFVCEWRH